LIPTSFYSFIVFTIKVNFELICTVLAYGNCSDTQINYKCALQDLNKVGGHNPGPSDMSLDPEYLP